MKKQQQYSSPWSFNNYNIIIIYLNAELLQK